LRKLWILVITGAILGGAALLEIYASVLYPVTEYEPGGLPQLAVGVERDYDFFKDGERVGSYSFLVEEMGQYRDQTAYFTRSLTSVTYHDTVIELETLYIFNEDLNPLEYRLNATLGEDRQFIICLFDGWNVNATMEMEDRTVPAELELPAGTVLIDNNMLCQWELFFKSFDPVPGKRVRFTAFVPQILDKKTVELFVEKGRETLTLNVTAYECMVVRAPDLDIVFYLHGGDLLKLEESEQDIEIVVASG